MVDYEVIRKRIDELEQHFGLRITIEADEAAAQLRSFFDAQR